MRSPRDLWAGLFALALASCSSGPDPEGTSEGAGTTSATEGSGGSTGATGEGSTGTGAPAWGSLDERPCPEDSALSLEDFGAPFMLTYCTGCHHSALAADERAGAPLGLDFDTLAGVRAHADRIWARSGDQNDTMPPVGPPPADARARLGEWLACGAPARDDL